MYTGPSPGSGIGHGGKLTTNPGNRRKFQAKQVSGVAPREHHRLYQVCYPVDGCPDEAISLATEQAISDGVDVINFSIGGSERFPGTIRSRPDLSARDAAALRCRSGGQPGPNFYTLNHSAPWYIQVAAETHDRVLGTSNANEGDITLGGTAPNIPVFNATTATGGISPFGTDPAQTYNLVVPSAMTPPLDPYCNTPFPAAIPAD